MQGPSGIQGPTLRGIDALRGKSDKDPEAVKTVAREIEALFAFEMIKAMRETIGNPEKSSMGNDTYMSLFDTELSRLFAERGLGLRDLLTKGLEKAAGTPDKPPVKENRIPATNSLPAILPANAPGRISSGFGIRNDPFTGTPKFHHGLDIEAPEGTAIHPIKKGTVVFSGEQPGYGNVVVIDHGNGYQSLYAHTSGNLVQKGDVVDSSTTIAEVGESGRSTGPHVHFEVRYQGESVNPRVLIAAK